MILDRIRAGTKNHQVIAWPGTRVKVMLTILSRGQMQEAIFAAHHHFRQADIPVETHTVEAFEDEKAIQILFRALTGVDGEEAGKPVGSDVDLFRATVTREELSELAVAYELLEQECSPNPDTMPDDQFNEFVETLKKKPDEILSSVRSIAFARRLLRSLVAPQLT